jgi:hypothetical protein
MEDPMSLPTIDQARSWRGRVGVVAVAVLAAGLAGLGRRRRRPPSLGDRVSQAGQEAAARGRMAVRKAGQEVAAVVAAIETTPESKRKARKRARARKRAMAAAAGAVRSVAMVLAAAWRWVRKSDAG